MTTYLIIAAGTAAVVAIVWIAIRAATREARSAGAADERAGAHADAREAEAEMTEIQGETITPEDLRKRIRDGTFGGQKP